jgi:hypothetical protein
MPYFHQKMPIAISHQGDGARPLIIIRDGEGPGARARGVEGTTLSEGRGTTRPLELFGAPDLDAGSINVEAPWRFLADILEEISFDTECVTEIEEGRDYELDGKTYPAIDLKVGADSWTIVLLHGQKAPVGHAKQDQAKQKADRLAGETMVKITTEQACDSFDDVYGPAWLKHEFGIEVESVNTRWAALPERQKKAFKEWAKGVMESHDDGWQRAVCSYDGTAYTSGVITRTVTKKPMILGFAYWRT